MLQTSSSEAVFEI